MTEWDAFVRVLATMPDTVRRLAAVHVPDEHGRCRACTIPGSGTARAPWPCSMASLAQTARQIRRNR